MTPADLVKASSAKVVTWIAVWGSEWAREGFLKMLTAGDGVREEGWAVGV